MKNRMLVLVSATLSLALSSLAQSPPSPATLPEVFQIGQPITINGQNFIVETNATGGLTIFTSGPFGTLTNIPPVNIQDLLNRAQEMVNANNPANKGYYTNELEFQVGAVYSQNSGQGAAKLSIEKWGPFGITPNIGAGAAVLEGNANGQHSTAGGYGFMDYRKVIGDVAGKIGAGAGYDNLNSSFMGVTQIEVEYRMNSHLGTYVGVGYALEPSHSSKATAQGGGLEIGGGISYAF